MADNRKKMEIVDCVKLYFVQAGKYIFPHIATLNFNQGISRFYSKI